MKFERGETEGRVVMVENASRKGVGALEDMIDPENDHRAIMIMGGGEKRTEVSLAKNTNRHAEEGSNGLVLNTFPTHPETRFQHFTNGKCTKSEREKNRYCSQ